MPGQGAIPEFAELGAKDWWFYEIFQTLIGAQTPLLSGSVNPNGQVTAAPNAIYQQTDPTTSSATQTWIKTLTTDNQNWVALSALTPPPPAANGPTVKWSRSFRQLPIPVAYRRFG